MKKSSSNNWRGILIWLLLALLLRWQVIEPRWIPSGSMLPTLKIQDKILVEKLSPKIKRKLHNHFDRNSIVIFKPPKALVNSGYDQDSALIKRVVGISGDTIEIHDGKLIRNNEVMIEPWIKESIKYELASIQVPDNTLWVLGDNRNNSLDSHFWGELPEENVIGTAFLRYWPLKRIGPIRFTQPK